MKLAYEKIVVPIGKPFDYPVKIGAPRKLETMSVVGQNVIVGMSVDKEIIPGPCGFFALRLTAESKITSPYPRIGLASPSVLLTGNCIGEII